MPEDVTRQQLLDELGYLATVEHALIVDYLIIHCALGADVLSDEHPATTAAGTAMNMAQSTMATLKAVNGALVVGGRQPSLGRASYVVPPSGRPLPVGSFTGEELSGFVGREMAVAGEVDRRWAAIGTALTALGSQVEDIAAELGAIPQHAASVAELVQPLSGLAPSQYLRVTRHLPADDFERKLLTLADLYYQSIVGSLLVFPLHVDLFLLRSTAVSLMFNLQSLLRVLVERGVVPGFGSQPLGT